MKITRQIKKEIAEYCDNLDPTDYNGKGSELDEIIGANVVEHFAEKYPDIEDELSDYVFENIQLSVSCVDGPI